MQAESFPTIYFVSNSSGNTRSDFSPHHIELKRTQDVARQTLTDYPGETNQLSVAEKSWCSYGTDRAVLA